MSYVEIDGIRTHYEVLGSGPPLLMMAHGGFNSVIENWRVLGAWKDIQPLEHFSQYYTCIVYDRREAGKSGGRVEAISWDHYARQAKGLLHHLDIEKAFVLGGCMGCNLAVAFGVRYPEMMKGLVLHWPTGGVRWRLYGQHNLTNHLTFVKEAGLKGVVDFAKEKKGFDQEMTAGPWASVIARDSNLAERFLAQNIGRYSAIIEVTMRNLFDRDTSPGAEPEELMALKVPALVIPGRDEYHATSAARYLEECLPSVQYHDVPVPDQTPDKVREWILAFLASQ